MVNWFNRVMDRPDLGKLVLRLAFSIMMIFHGWHKLIGGVGVFIYHAGGLPADRSRQGADADKGWGLGSRRYGGVFLCRAGHRLPWQWSLFGNEGSELALR